jgi:formylglycine-generating enzyme required for sulfatase activity
MPPIKVFIIYAHEDAPVRDRLRSHLHVQVENGSIDLWADYEIKPGEDWDQKITEKLNQSDLLILLLSADFFTSEYLRKKELPDALRRHAAGECRLLPVIARECDWEDHPIGKIQALPPEGQPIDSTEWPSKDRPYKLVVDGIKAAVKELLPARQTSEVSSAQLPTAKTLPPNEPEKVPAPAAKSSIPTSPLPSFADSIARNMVLVQGGTFQMGDKSHGPIHPVTLSDFYISKFQVTQADWRSVMGSDPSKRCVDCPVKSVNWNDIQDFLTKLNARTGLHYRLPTEAEWEYAARGGNLSKDFKYAGSNNLDEVAWYEANSSEKTHPVGQKCPNELGLYDMSGNVWEWCQDWYQDLYDSYSASAQTNPTGPNTGSYRVIRGGSWYDGPKSARVAYRSGYRPSVRRRDIGFRLARTI